MDSHAMDPIKKRKLDENGLSTPASVPEPTSLDPTQTQSQTLTISDTRKILEPFTAEQLRDILASAAAAHVDTLAAVRAIADRDVTLRKLFIRGLGWETTSDSLSSVFAAYGVLEEAVVILDKATGKSKGYGFVTFRHVDGAMLALKQPSKLIDGRIAVAALASAGLGGGGGGGPGGGGGGGDTSLRKIYVGNVPTETSAERLLSVFSSFGEIEEGPLGFDKATGKSKGFALFVYKTVEGAQAALMEPLKIVDGRQVVCKLASEGKKGKPPGGGGGDQMGMGMGMGMAPPSNSGGPGGGGYPGPGGGGGYSSYSGFSGGGQQPSNPMNPSYNSSVGGQGPGGYGGNAGYGSGGGYGGGGGGGSYYGSGPNSGGYGGYGGSGGAVGGVGSGGAGRGGYGGMAPNSGGMPSGGGYADGGHYGMSSGGYPSQQHQHTGASPAPRVPPAGAGGYPNPPPYY